MSIVLIVDDEANIRWTLSAFLDRAGYTVFTAAGFEEALDAFRQHAIDVAVVDVILPGGTGIQLLEEIRKRQEYVPFVMITGDPNLETVSEALNLGAYDYLVKPVAKEAMLNAVSRALEKKRLIDEKRSLEQEIKRYAEELEVRVDIRTAELAAANSFLNTVLVSSTEYAIIAVNTEDRVILFNRGAELTFGYREEEMRGHLAKRLMAGSESFAGRPFLQLGQMSEAAGRHYEEVSLRRKDGSVFIGSAAVTPIREPEGELLGYLGILKDLTVEREREAALRESEERFKAFMNNSPAVAFVKDEDGRHIYVNEPFERLFNQSSEELRNKTDFDIWPHEIAARLRANDLAVLSAGKTLEVMESVPTPDGQLHDWLTFKFPISDSVGRRFLAGIAVDITERRRAEEQLRQMEARLAQNEKIAVLGRMAAQVAHEVKNPLAGLRLYAMHLREKLEGKMSAGDMTLVDKVAQSVEHLSQTVERVLSFARPVALRRQKVDLDRLIADTFHILSPQLASNQIEWSVESSCVNGARFGMFDGALIRSAFTNLLLNAIQAMPGGGCLIVTNAVDEKHHRITIRDTGCGMTREEIERVFEPFYTTKDQGLGLGMPYARRVIEEHGGQIFVESRPKEGTIVTVELPAEE